MQKGRIAEVRRALEEALQAAQAIPDKMARDMNIAMISKALTANAKQLACAQRKRSALKIRVHQYRKCRS